MSISIQAAEQRYQQFVAEVSRTRKLWALRNREGWANWSTENGPVFPLWSDAASARRCSEVTFIGYEPFELELGRFLEQCLPMLRDKGFFLGVNLTDDLAGIDLSCDEFKRQLNRGDA